MKPEKIAGALLFSGALQFLLCMMIAESNYPGYSTMNDFISQLGVGATSGIFNVSVIVLGLSLILSSYFLYKIKEYALVLPVLFTGISSIGVGIFPMDSPGPYHVFFSFMAFLFGGLTTIFSYKAREIAIGAFSITMGVISLSALALFASGNNLSFGVGLVERMIAWPVILWAMIFGFNMMRICRKV